MENTYFYKNLSRYISDINQDYILKKENFINKLNL